MAVSSRSSASASFRSLEAGADGSAQKIIAGARMPLVVSLIALTAGCASQQEICINRASAELRNLEARATEVRVNINRGYAVHTSKEAYTVLTQCANPDGTTYPCEETRHQIKETPVSLDIAAERQKLTQLRRRIAGARSSMEQAIQQCRLAHPE